MTTDEYFEKSRFRARIKKSSINFLFSRWESRVNRIPFDSHYLFDEWTNDLWTQAAIQKIFLACEIPEEIRQRLETIDEIYRQKTIPLSDIGITNFCLEKDWDKENYWFTYRLRDGMIGNSIINTRYIFMKKRRNNFCILPITSYGGMGEIRTCIRKGAYGQRLKRYPFCCLRKHLRFLERKRKNTAGAEQQRQKDTSEKRGAAFCFCKVVVNKMQQSAIKRKPYRKNNYWKGGFCKYEEQIQGDSRK